MEDSTQTQPAAAPVPVQAPPEPAPVAQPPQVSDVTAPPKEKTHLPQPDNELKPPVHQPSPLNPPKENSVAPAIAGAVVFTLVLIGLIVFAYLKSK